MNGSPRFALVAGETSGDLLAGLLLGGMRERWPDQQSYGIGGPRMAEQGFEAWWPSERLAVRGYIEVLRHYRGIIAIRNQLRQRLLTRDRPDLFIGVDAPDFNLDLEAALKAQGVPTVHFVCPSIWAWRADRVEKIRRSVNHVLCIFPFEPELLARHGIAATYVGHPLANVIPLQPDRAAARTSLGLSLDVPVVAILPGSRASELQYLGPRFLQAAVRIRQARPGVRFVIPAVPALRERIEQLVRDSGLTDAAQVLDGQSHMALAACDVTLIASGTATLEAALFKRPMVIAYNMHWLSWQIMRRKQLQPWVGLPNILCENAVVPELLQDAATPASMAQGVLDWLDDAARIEALQQRFQALHLTLKRDTAQLATNAIEQVLEG
ncbi:lipid-A-disaccharide synthase [Hydrogenophaga sp.]|uniref:lipid-A-disaccharide synthase n=1 Tax=Hydrogenophaga sp. TaxID=1904254 RepID=UPI0025C74113|nr:lipid-A-disaccharide synthase [Hydrogenophaga sp.]